VLRIQTRLFSQTQIPPALHQLDALAGARKLCSEVGRLLNTPGGVGGGEGRAPLGGVGGPPRGGGGPGESLCRVLESWWGGVSRRVGWTVGPAKGSANIRFITRRFSRK